MTWPTVTTLLEVEILSDTALKLWYSKFTVSRTDVYDKILLLDLRTISLILQYEILEKLVTCITVDL